MEVKKWKWKVRKSKKINQELHSQRCDTELKLSVSLLFWNSSSFVYACFFRSKFWAGFLFGLGCSEVERRGRILLSSQSWFSRTCIPYASSFESLELGSMSGNPWICWRTTSRKVRIALAENTFSKSLCRGNREALLRCTPCICRKPHWWHIRFSKQSSKWKSMVVKCWGSFSVLSSLH